MFSRLTREFSYVCETILTAVFAGSTVAMSIVMLMIQMEMVEYLFTVIFSLFQIGFAPGDRFHCVVFHF